MSELAFRAGAVLLVTLVLVYVHRVATGPTVFDRILGVSGFGTKTTLLLPLIGVLFDRLDLFIDLSLAYALLNFVGSLAAARYFESVNPR